MIAGSGATQKNSRRLGGEPFFWLCFLLYTAVTFWLFYQQSLEYDGPLLTSSMTYLSDMPYYIAGVLGTNIRDVYTYPLFFWLVELFYNFMPIELAAALVTTLLNTLTVFVARHYINKYLAPETIPQLGRADALRPYIPTAALFCCLLASMIILPVSAYYITPGEVYLGHGTGNMWHNATYLATRPFATLAFFSFGELLNEYEKRIDWKKAVLFSASLLLTTLAKPTFTVVLVPAAGILLLVRLIKSRGKNIKNTLLLLLTFLPTGADLIRQYVPMFGDTESSGIGFGFGAVWGLYTKSIPVALLLCYGFALYILLTNLKYLKQKPLLRYTWVLVAVALFEALFLFEDGWRMIDGNFMQGHQHMMFYVFIVSTITWLSQKGEHRKPLYNAGAGALFAAHVVSGVYYFVRILLGNKFY